MRLFSDGNINFLMWYFLDSKISFELSLIVSIYGRCASFTVLTATVSEIFGGQTNSSILVSLVYGTHRVTHNK